MKRLCQFIACLLTMGTLTAPLQADEIIVDNSFEFDPRLWPFVRYNSIWRFYAPSMSFTPKLDFLDFVDLVTTSAGTDSTTATLQALILYNTNVIGASDLLLVTNAVPVTNRFFFSPSVPLKPGSNYVIQLQTLDNNWTVLGITDLFFRNGKIIRAQVPPPISIQVSHVDICWSSRTGTTYQVQYRSGLTTNVWTDLGTPIPGNGLTNCITDVLAGPRRFYRVNVLP